MITLTTFNGLLYISPPLEELKMLLVFTLRRTEPKTQDVWIDGEMRTVTRGFQYTATQQALYWETPDRESIVTYHNLIHRVADYCAQKGYPIQVEHKSEYVQPRIGPETVEGLYPEQVRCFINMISRRGGAMLEGAMGAGKTMVILAFIKAYLHCRSIVIMTHRQAVVDRLEEGLNKLLAPLGIEVSVMTGARRVKKSHVMIATSGMIEELEPDNLDVLIFDEVHRSAGDRIGERVAHFLKTVKYGFSGTISKRSDGKELYLEAIYGPIADTITDQEAEALGRVTPARVFALSVPRGPDVRKVKSADIQEKRAITYNPERNMRIKQVVDLAPAVQQLLIFVRTQAHVEELTTRYLVGQGFETYHSGISQKEKDRIKGGIENGTLLRIISTDCLEEGIDTVHLDILIDANWTSTNTSVSQKGGRNRRLKEGKRWGVFVNFQDEWCDNLRKAEIEKAKSFSLQVEDAMKRPDRLKARADKRLSQYRDRGWSIERIDEASDIEFDVGQALPEESVQQEIL